MRFQRFFIPLLVCVASPNLFAQSPSEPKYEGKSIEYWVDRFQKAENDQDRERAVVALKSFGEAGAPAVPKLVEMLADCSQTFRAQVVDILSVYSAGARSAVPDLVKLLKEKNAKDPELIISLLGSIGPDAKEAIPILTEFLNSHELRYYAYEALCGIGPASKGSLPKFDRVLRSAVERHVQLPLSVASLTGVPPLPRSMFSCLYKVGPDATQLLLSALDWSSVGSSTLDIAGIAESLGKIGTAAKAASPRVAKLLRYDDCSVRLNAAIALWKIDRLNDAISTLIDLLKYSSSDSQVAGNVGNCDFFVARDAAAALGEIGPAAKAALPALQEIVSRGDGIAGDDARAAIEKIKSESK
jgi:HEAT repeat protein